MQMIEPNATQHRAAAVALIIVAALTAAMVVGQWVSRFSGPLLLTVVVAYFLFNFGFIFAIVKGRLQTKGARLGLVAVLINVLAMFLASLPVIWTIMSLSAFIAALIASFMIFKDARSAAA